MDPSFPEALETAKRASTAQLLFKCARLLNEHALATIPTPEGTARPRPAHMALFPHIALEGTRPSELAKKLGISKQAVGQLVGELEAMGVVERQPDPDDGRAKRVVFTEQGLQGILEGLAHLRRVEAELAEAIGEDTMASLREALLVLHDHLDTEP
ncbi:MAG: MarR family transcriptional regulator [Deltaproteobacteria bacterium]|nr:MarR family transcriptional regulator [Deltaproteobacteria bacterium]